MDTLFLLLPCAFFAGLVDAAVGGGGLIQIPALFSFVPNAPAAALFGTNKFASVCGTIVAARNYVRRVKLPWALLLPALISAFIMAFAGAATVSLLPRHIIKIAVFFLLVLMAIYTLWKKDFGKVHTPVVVGTKQKIQALCIGGCIGFYDGFFGPGTGSFLIFLFIRFFAFDFLHASAAAKCVNIATNIAAIAFFAPTANIIWQLAIPMACANIAGGFCGSWLALHKGTGFVRGLFLVLVCGLISKLGFEIFF